MQQEYYLGSSLVSRAQNTTAGLRKVGSGVVARAQLYKGHELGQEARAHARCTPCQAYTQHPHGLGLPYRSPTCLALEVRSKPNMLEFRQCTWIHFSLPILSKLIVFGSRKHARTHFHPRGLGLPHPSPMCLGLGSAPGSSCNFFFHLACNFSRLVFYCVVPFPPSES